MQQYLVNSKANGVWGCCWNPIAPICRNASCSCYSSCVCVCFQFCWGSEDQSLQVIVDDASKTCHVVTVHAFGCDLEVFFFWNNRRPESWNAAAFLPLLGDTDWLAQAEHVDHTPARQLIPGWTRCQLYRDWVAEGYEHHRRIWVGMPRHHEAGEGRYSVKGSVWLR